MTKQEIYDTIVYLTTEIKATNVGSELFKAAMLEKSEQKVREIAYTFVRKNPLLYKKMFAFASDFNRMVEKSETGDECVIFGLKREEKDGFFLFDTDVIHASSFFVLTFLTDIDDSYLFTGDCIEVGDEEFITPDSAYLIAIEKESGSSELADFLALARFSEDTLEDLADYNIKATNIYELLVEVMAGELKEYVD